MAKGLIQSTPSIASPAGILTALVLTLGSVFLLSQFSFGRSLMGTGKGMLPTGGSTT